MWFSIARILNRMVSIYKSYCVLDLLLLINDHWEEEY